MWPDSSIAMGQSTRNLSGPDNWRFPYPRDFHGQWFWESGFDKDAFGDAEDIRD
jgi:hypothetical protein